MLLMDMTGRLQARQSQVRLLTYRHQLQRHPCMHEVPPGLLKRVLSGLQLIAKSQAPLPGFLLYSS